MSVIRTLIRMSSFTAIELSSGSLKSKRDMKALGGRTATRSIIIVPVASYRNSLVPGPGN